MIGSPQKRDYYEVLGVDRSATQEQLKQAYHQLAMKWHPDRNTAADATDKFKEIAEAYAVLSDQAKRRAYDTSGHAGVSERWSTEEIFRGFDLRDIFRSQLNDVWSTFGNLSFGRPPRASIKPQGADLRYDLHLTLDDAAKGGARTIQLTRSDRCKSCGGNGAQPGTKPVSCVQCHGSGEQQQARGDKKMRVDDLDHLRALPRARLVHRIALRHLQRQGPANSCRTGSRCKYPPASNMACCSGSPAKARPAPKARHPAIFSCASTSNLMPR